MSNNPYSSAQNSWNQQPQPGPYAPQGHTGQSGRFNQFGQFGQPGFSGMSPQQPGPTKNIRRRSQAKLGLFYALGYVVVIWAVHIISTVIFGGGLVHYGIHPLEPSSLPHIFTSPILHVNFEHLMSNTVPGAIFAFLIGYSGHRVFWEVTAFVVMIGGLGTWLFGGPGTNHVGASMLVYGWLAYLLVRGIFNRSASQIALGVLLGLMYSGLVWGVLPLDADISWQAHLFGAIGGIAAGVVINSDDPPELRARKRAKKAQQAQPAGAPYPPNAGAPGMAPGNPQPGPYYNPPRP